MTKVVLIDRCLDCGWLRHEQWFFCGLTYYSIAGRDATECDDIYEAPIPDSCPLMDTANCRGQQAASRWLIQSSYGTLISSCETEAVVRELWELRDGSLWLGDRWLFSDDMGCSIHERPLSSVYRELDLNAENLPKWALDDYLMAHGYDPKSVGDDMRALAERILNDLDK